MWHVGYLLYMFLLSRIFTQQLPTKSLTNELSLFLVGFEFGDADNGRIAARGGFDPTLTSSRAD